MHQSTSPAKRGRNSRDAAKRRATRSQTRKTSQSDTAQIGLRIGVWVRAQQSKGSMNDPVSGGCLHDRSFFLPFFFFFFFSFSLAEVEGCAPRQKVEILFTKMASEYGSGMFPNSNLLVPIANCSLELQMALKGGASGWLSECMYNHNCIVDPRSLTQCKCFLIIIILTPKHKLHETDSHDT